MRRTIVICLIFMLPGFAFAQGAKPGEEKLEAKKVAFLTTKLDLSAADAKIFWPIYNDFTREQTALRRERFQKMISFRKIKEIDDLTDAEIQTLIVNDFDFKQRELTLEKKYYSKLKSSLPIKVVGKYYRAQESFKKEILNQFRGTNGTRRAD